MIIINNYYHHHHHYYDLHLRYCTITALLKYPTIKTFCLLFVEIFSPNVTVVRLLIHDPFAIICSNSDWLWKKNILHF